MTLEPGLERVDEFIVADRLVTDVGGTIGARVLSTPGMIAMMERTSSIVSFENLPDGKATVGFEVCVKHVAAAFFRAAGRRFEPPWTPSALVALGAVICAVLVAYRIIQEPGNDQVTTVQAGAPLAVAVLGALAFASAAGLRNEESGKEFREPRVRSEPATPAG